MKPDIYDIMFDSHELSDDGHKAIAGIRRAGKELARAIVENAPHCPDRSTALRKVREAVFTANAAVSLNGENFTA